MNWLNLFLGLFVTGVLSTILGIIIELYSRRKANRAK